jgi:hypothetical protein
MGGGFLYFGTRVSDGMPIYPCYLIFVTGKLNLFLKKFTILIRAILFRQFWSFLGFAALSISAFRCPKDLD